MTEPRKLRVFLCHASQDKPVVRELYQRLNAEGWIDPWLDEVDILPGQDWDLEIEKAVESSDLVLVCISNHSVSKEGYIQKELRLVLDVTMNMPEGAIFLIPLKLEDCEVPRRIRTWQWVDYFPPANRVNAYKRLLASLKLRAEKVGVSLGKKAGAPIDPLVRQPVRTTRTEDESPIPAPVPFPDLDLYIPPEYSGLPFMPPPAKVPTWTFGGMEFVKVPHGDFLMGSKDNDEDAFDDEKPQHTLHIPYDYLMARFPVTNALFRTFVKQTSYKTKAEADISGLENHPVVQVIWKDAQAFCE